MSDQASRNLRGRLGARMLGLYPELDHDVWTLKRRRHVRNASRLLGVEATALPRGRDAAAPERHVVVVASHGPDVPNWHVAGGHIFFELHQSAIEVLGAERVTLFTVHPDEAEEHWHRRLLRCIAETSATHVIAQIEADPNQPQNWSWDVIGSVLEASWDGVLVGVMHDVAYRWLGIRARRLGGLMPRLLIVELCEPMDGFVQPGRYEVGPVTMPMSQATIAAIDARVHGLPKLHDVSFIGALYGYRVDLLNRLRERGLTVSVNPHRAEATSNEAESRRNLPSYLDYMAGLAQSDMTINFSLANGGPHEQYKIRVHEAALVGCICLTDDTDRSRHFYGTGEVEYFDSLDSLADVAMTRLADRDRLRIDQERARTRAHELSRTDFWGRIDDGLRLRGLPLLTGLRPPAEP
jgi:hypothetical protein